MAEHTTVTLADIQRYIYAARVPRSLKPQSFGLWEIRRESVGCRNAVVPPATIVGFPDYTILLRWTVASLHQEYGDVVMEDSRRELQRHLPIFMAASGNVLLTGLGLGCVLRGLLAKAEVRSITVLEIDKDILRIVGHEFGSNRRVRLINADAFTWRPDRRFDYGYHDIERMDDAQPHLSVLHMRLLLRYSDHCAHQGAWGMPRWVRHFMPPNLRLERADGKWR